MKENILIVNDSVETRVLLARFLEASGFVVYEAQDGGFVPETNSCATPKACLK